MSPVINVVFAITKMANTVNFNDVVKGPSAVLDNKTERRVLIDNLPPGD